MLAEVVQNTPWWYVASSPAAVVAAVAAIWFAGRPERRRRSTSDQRVHDALFGYREGATKFQGIVDIVQGNGKGNLLKLAEANKDSTDRLEQKQREIGSEIRTIRESSAAAAEAANAAKDKAIEATATAAAAYDEMKRHVDEGS